MKIKLVKCIRLFGYREIKSLKDLFSLGPENLEEKTYTKIVDIEWLNHAPRELYIKNEGRFRRNADLDLPIPVYVSGGMLGRELFEEECQKSLRDGWEEE